MHDCLQHGEGSKEAEAKRKELAAVAGAAKPGANMRGNLFYKVTVKVRAWVLGGCFHHFQQETRDTKGVSGGPGLGALRGERGGGSAMGRGMGRAGAHAMSWYCHAQCTLEYVRVRPMKCRCGYRCCVLVGFWLCYGTLVRLVVGSWGWNSPTPLFLATPSLLE